MSGYARFHRSLIGHPAFRNDAESMAFAYLVLRASWKPVRVRYKGKSIELNRGQLAVSVRDLADALDRDKGWVERLLKKCRAEGMCETHADAGVMVVTICNYDKYQSSNENCETADKTPNETPARQARDTEQRREEYKKEEKEVTADAASSIYAFEGKVIRLKPSDLAKWASAYFLLDLPAVLQSRDDWLATEADDATRKKWFVSTSNHLANLQRRAAEAKTEQRRVSERLTI